MIVTHLIELDHPELLKELRQLELELLPGGMARNGHPKWAEAHDDHADAVALACHQLITMRVPWIA